MKNLNTSTGSKFYVDLKNVKISVVKVFFLVDKQSSNEDKRERQVKNANNIWHTRTLKSLSLSFSKHTRTRSNKQSHGLEHQIH